MYNKLPWKKPKLFRGNCQNPWFLKLFSFFWRGLPLIIKKCLGTSLRASYKGRSGGGAGKGRRACNYVSGIWMSASKKPVPGVRIVESRRKIHEGKKKNEVRLSPPPHPVFPVYNLTRSPLYYLKAWNRLVSKKLMRNAELRRWH